MRYVAVFVAASLLSLPLGEPGRVRLLGTLGRGAMCGEKVALSLPYFLGDSCAPPCTVVDHVSVASRAAKACQSDSERLYREGFGDARGFGALAPGGISSAAQPVTDKLKLGCEEEAPRAKKPNSLLR